MIKLTDEVEVKAAQCNLKEQNSAKLEPPLCLLSKNTLECLDNSRIFSESKAISTAAQSLSSNIFSCASYIVQNTEATQENESDSDYFDCLMLKWNQRQSEFNLSVSEETDRLSKKLSKYIVKNPFAASEKNSKQKVANLTKSPLSPEQNVESFHQVNNIPVLDDQQKLSNVVCLDQKPKTPINSETLTLKNYVPKLDFEMAKTNPFSISDVDSFKIVMTNLFKGETVAGHHKSCLFDNFPLVSQMIVKKFKREVEMPRNFEELVLLINQLSVNSKRNEEKLKFILKKTMKEMRKDLILLNLWHLSPYSRREITQKFYEHYFPGGNVSELISMNASLTTITRGCAIKLLKFEKFRAAFIDKFLTMDFSHSINKKMHNWVDKIRQQTSAGQTAIPKIKKLPWTAFEIREATDFFKKFLQEVFSVMR